jgi:hypothetical protein
MKRNLLVLSLVVALTLMAASAFAGAAAMRITVPFDFYAGADLLPAGEYTFEMASGLVQTGSIITIRSINGAGVCILLSRPGSDPSYSKLLFNKYGSRHFLSSVSIQGFKAGLRMEKLERELQAQSSQPNGVVTIALNRK